jgi:hypothetical protein
MIRDGWGSDREVYREVRGKSGKLVTRVQTFELTAGEYQDWAMARASKDAATWNGFSGK